MTDTFDPQQYVDELEAVGVPKAQASVHARTLARVLKNVICAADLDRAVEILRSEIEQAEKRLNMRIEMVRTELKADIAVLRAEMQALAEKFESLRTELILHRWALGGLFAISSANLALTFRLAFP